MADSTEDKIYYTDWNGRSYADINALLNHPKVKATIERMSKADAKLRGRKGLIFLKPPAKTDE